MLEKEFTYATLTPIFPMLKWVTDEHHEESMFVDIDDCECSECGKERGFIEPYCTLRVGLRFGKKSIVARLTPEEAISLAETLLEYSQLVSEIAEEGELDELEKMA